MPENDSKQKEKLLAQISLKMACGSKNKLEIGSPPVNTSFVSLPDHYIDMEKFAVGKVRARRYRNPKIGDFLRN